MDRPKHLPDFSEPPLDEVVLGVQFAPTPNLSSISSYGIWKLFSDELPKVQEHSLLEPKFETFGGGIPQQGNRIHIGPPSVGSRFWFLSEDENHLLQFQSDRLLTNWRKHPAPEPYPRFEGIAQAFEARLHLLDQHFSKHFSHAVDVNQAEIAYINIIPVDKFSSVGHWLNIWSGNQLDIEGINLSFAEVIKNDDGKPFARLFYEIHSAFSLDGKDKAIRLALTFRGKPESNSIKSAMKFLETGREKIVARFSEITTKEAHNFWRRIS